MTKRRSFRLASAADQDGRVGGWIWHTRRAYRGDGARIEKLLSDADQDLYAEKARRVKRGIAAFHARRRARDLKPLNGTNE